MHVAAETTARESLHAASPPGSSSRRVFITILAVITIRIIRGDTWPFPAGASGIDGRDVMREDCA